MNDKMIPYEELRGEVRVYKTLVECIAFNMHVIIKMPNVDTTNALRVRMGIA